MSQELRLWKLRMWLLNVITLMFSISFNGISTVLSQYAVLQFDATPIQVGVLWSSFFIISIFTRPVAGRASDSGYRFRLLIIGNLMFIISSITYLFATNFVYLLIARLFQGLSQGIFMTSAFSLVAYEASTHIENFEESIAWRSAMLGLGTVIGPAIFGYVVSLYGFMQAFSLIIFLSVITIFGVLATIKATKVKEDLNILRYGNEENREPNIHIANLFSGFGEIFKVSNFRKALATVFLYSLGYIAITSFLPAYYAIKFGKESGIIIGNCLSLIGISSLFPRILSGKLSKRWKCQKISRFGLLLLCASLLLLGLFPLPPYVYIVSFGIGIGVGFVIPSLQIMALLDIRNSKKGIATGMYIIGWDASNLIAPLIFGTIGNTFGYESVLQISFVPVLIAFLFLSIAKY